MHILRIPFVFLLTIIVSSCQTTSHQVADQEYHDKPKALEVTKDMTWTLRNTSNQSWSEYHAKDGTLYTGTRTTSYGTGEWWIDDEGRYCINHPEWRWGHERCQRIKSTKDGGIVLFWDDTPDKQGRYASGRITKGDKYDFVGRYSE